MIDKEKYTQHIQDQEAKERVIRALGKIEGVLKSHDIRWTEFLTPYEQEQVIGIINSFQEITYKTEGGYQGAERQVITIFHDYLPADTVPPSIIVVKINNKNRFKTLSHRDYLGSVLNLGLKREKIGDIVVHESYCHMIVDKEMGEYIRFQLQKVGNAPVDVEMDEFDNIEKPEEATKEIHGSVSSLRLDAIISLGCKLSRKDAQTLIKKGDVKVNFQEASKMAQELEDGDRISAKGFGRMTLHSLGKQTKSGRIKIMLEKLL